MIQRVSRENSGQTELEEREREKERERERELCNTIKHLFQGDGEDKENGFFLSTIL